MSILNVKSACEANIPIVKPFLNVGKVGIPGPLLSPMKGGNLRADSTKRNNLTGQCWDQTHRTHVIREWSTSTPAASPTMATATVTTASCIKLALGKILLQWTGQLLDGRYLECVGRPAGGLGSRQRETHRGHLGHDCRLICR